LDIDVFKIPTLLVKAGVEPELELAPEESPIINLSEFREDIDIQSVFEPYLVKRKWPMLSPFRW